MLLEIEPINLKQNFVGTVSGLTCYDLRRNSLYFPLPHDYDQQKYVYGGIREDED